MVKHVKKAKGTLGLLLTKEKATSETLSNFVRSAKSKEEAIARIAVLLAGSFTEDLRYGLTWNMPATYLVMNEVGYAEGAYRRRDILKMWVYPPTVDDEELEVQELYVYT